MKALPNGELCSEKLVILKLAEIMPKHFSMPIAHFGESLNRTSNSKVLKAWVKIQKDFISSMKELENAGIPKGDAGWLIEKTKETLEDSEWMDEHWNGMTAERRERVETLSNYKEGYLRYVSNLCESIPFTNGQRNIKSH